MFLPQIKSSSFDPSWSMSTLSASQCIREFILNPSFIFLLSSSHLSPISPHPQSCFFVHTFLRHTYHIQQCPARLVLCLCLHLFVSLFSFYLPLPLGKILLDTRNIPRAAVLFYRSISFHLEHQTVRYDCSLHN